MHSSRFFGSLGCLDQYMCNLYSDGQPLSEIKNATYSELKHFSRYHDLIQSAYKKAGEIKGK
jgi:hypothetical protein